MRSWLVVGALALCLGTASPAHPQEGATPALRPPIAAENAPKLRPGFARPDLRARHTAAGAEQRASAVRADRLRTLPHWQRSFSIQGKTYHYTIVGGDPKLGGTTAIRVVLVPIRLTIPDFSADGRTPVVFDAAPVLPEIMGSPIFAESSYPSGRPGPQQFADALLRVEVKKASEDWHTRLDPVAGRPLAIDVPSGGATVMRARSGALLASIEDDTILDDPIFERLQSREFAAEDYVIFVTANALQHDAFGYHDAVFLGTSGRGEERVMTYTSYLFGVDDLFDVPSPDSATLSHEVAEVIHDAFLEPLTSTTLLWGDPFSEPKNECFQDLIEVGDAVEDAPASVQLHPQPVGDRTYTVQNVALLQWFLRLTPSNALGGAYSFPDRSVLRRAAPLKCTPSRGAGAARSGAERR